MSIFKPLPLTIVESPYKATAHYTAEQHRLYLLHAIEDCLRRGEAPYASHHLIPEILDDDDHVERAFGIKCGLAWGMHADLVAVYSDLGVGDGMKDAIEHYSRIGKRIEWRKLPDKVVAAVKRFDNFGEFTPTENPPDDPLKIRVVIDSPAASFVPPIDRE
jgi:hypothetical protein